MSLTCSSHFGEKYGLVGRAFDGFYSYRVGNYRIIYEITEEAFEDDELEKIILVRRIRHRKDVYNDPI